MGALIDIELERQAWETLFENKEAQLHSLCWDARAKFESLRQDSKYKDLNLVLKIIAEIELEFKQKIEEIIHIKNKLQK